MPSFSDLYLDTFVVLSVSFSLLLVYMAWWCRDWPGDRR